MGNDCSAFHRAKAPNPQFPNKNICTEYEDGMYDPANPQNNAINTGAQYEVNNSAFLAPPDICIPSESVVDDIELVSAIATAGLILPGIPAVGGIASAVSIGATGGFEIATGNDALDYCTNISEPTADGKVEWVPVTSKDWLGKTVTKPYSTCLYNDSDNKTRISKPGCCGPSCAIAGQGIQCKRVGFNADPIPCCFLDFSCAGTGGNGIPDACWQTTSRKRTCDPRYRDLSSSECLEQIKPYCTGEKLFAGQNNWMEAWIPGSFVDVNSGTTTATNLKPADARNLKQPCLRALARAVYSDSGNVCTWEQFEKLDVFQGTINPAGLAWAQEVLNSILERYTKEYGSPIGKINQDGYLASSDFLDFYYSLCKKFPVICQQSLTNFCATVKKEDLIESPEQLKWCGCYMNDSQYQEYEKFSIDRQCTPPCNNQGNIPLVDLDNVPKICTQTTCIIDNFSVNLAKVSNPDGLQFNQLCNSCGQSKISKYFDGSDSIVNGSNTTSASFAIAGGPGCFEQFIPDNVKGVSFWYNLAYNSAIRDEEGYLLVRLEQCNITSGNSTFLPITNSNNPIVTLDYSSSYFDNYNKLGPGKLYYITGIKKIYYKGDIETNLGLNSSWSGINSFLNTNSNVGEGANITFNQNFDYSNSSYYTNFNSATTNNNYGYLIYQDITYDWNPGTATDYITGINSLFGLNSNIETNLVNDGSLKPGIWACWSHYTKVFPASVTRNNTQQINNSVREDNIAQISNTCSCLLTGTLTAQDSEIRSLNLYEKCGNSQCFDANGQSVACGSNGSNTISQTDSISIINSIKSFEKNIVSDKRELITVVLLGILIILIIIWVALQYRKKNN